MVVVYVWRGGYLKTRNGSRVTVNPADGVIDVARRKGHENHNVGHSSMLISGGLPSGERYISWWPAESKKGWLDAPPAMPKNVAKDTENENNVSPIAIVLHGLDETNIKKWWFKRRKMASSKQARYRAWGSNCSTTIYMALVAGGAWRYTPWGEGDMPWGGSELCDPENFTCGYWAWWPLKLERYALRVQSGLLSAKKGDNRRRNFSLVKRVKDASLKKAVQSALVDDGKITLREVKYLCEATKDGRGVSKREARELKILQKHSKSMDESCREYIKKFLKSVNRWNK